MSQIQTQTQNPKLYLSREEEEMLGAIDRKINGCPYFYHTEMFHVSNILKHLFLQYLYDELIINESLSEDEANLLIEVERRVDDWWIRLCEDLPEDIYIDIEEGDWEEIYFKIFIDSKSEEVTGYFKKIGDGWTITVLINNKEVELIDYIKSRWENG